jgi:hypothetical protein
MGRLTDAKMSYQTESFMAFERAAGYKLQAASMKSHQLPEACSLQLEAAIRHSKSVESLITF